MLPNRFHRKERHVTTNQQSSKKRSQTPLAGWGLWPNVSYWMATNRILAKTLVRIQFSLYKDESILNSQASKFNTN